MDSDETRPPCSSPPPANAPPTIVYANATPTADANTANRTALRCLRAAGLRLARLRATLAMSIPRETTHARTTLATSAGRAAARAEVQGTGRTSVVPEAVSGCRPQNKKELPTFCHRSIAEKWQSLYGQTVLGCWDLGNKICTSSEGSPSLAHWPVSTSEVSKSSNRNGTLMGMFRVPKSPTHSSYTSLRRKSNVNAPA